MTIYQIIQQLEATSLRTEKEKILRDNKDNEVLQRFFFLCLDPFTTFGVKKIPKPNKTDQKISLEEAMVLLDKLATREITGNSAIDFLANLLGSLEDEDRDVLTRIVKRKPNCGVSDSTVNDIWEKLVPVYPCLLASPFTEKLVSNFDWKNAWVETKYDSKRCNIIVNTGTVRLFSRSGQEMNVLGSFDSLNTPQTNGFMIDGELIARNKDGSYLTRSVSNGIANKATKNTLSQEEADSLILVAWDIVPYEDFLDGYSPIPLKTRLQILKERITSLEAIGVTKILLAEGQRVYSMEEVHSFYAKMIERNEEGCMLKDLNDPWEDTRSKKVIKFKEEKSAEFRIMGWNDGKDALEGNLGSLNCESEDGIVKFDCSGFPLELRSQIYANLTNAPVKYSVVKLNEETVLVANPGDCPITLFSVIEVTYNRKEQDKHGNWSIFLPRFKQHRDDKKKANTFEEIL